jgi:hypothetical protein
MANAIVQATRGVSSSAIIKDPGLGDAQRARHTGPLRRLVRRFKQLGVTIPSHTQSGLRFF